MKNLDNLDFRELTKFINKLVESGNEVEIIKWNDIDRKILINGVLLR